MYDIVDQNVLELWSTTAFGTAASVRIATDRKRSNVKCAAFEKEPQLGNTLDNLFGCLFYVILFDPIFSAPRKPRLTQVTQQFAKIENQIEQERQKEKRKVETLLKSKTTSKRSS